MRWNTDPKFQCSGSQPCGCQLRLASTGDGQWERELDIIACAGPGARLDSVSVKAGRGAGVDERARLEIA